MHFLDILILLLAVLFILKKLKSILGTQPNMIKQNKISQENASKIFAFIMQEAEKQQKKEEKIIASETSEENSPIEYVLNKIPNFNKKIFLKNAMRAFEIIVEAVAQGDKASLKPLLNNSLFEKISAVLDDRKENGIVAETDFIGFDKVEIINATLNDEKMVSVVVKFISQQVNLLKNKDGEIIEGDPQFIQTISDCWTFEKDITSNNPSWSLASTKNV